MSNLFDTNQLALIGVVDLIMGTDAVWLRSLNSTEADMPGKVLFNDPTEKVSFHGMPFHPEQPWVEYFLGTFPGLKERSDSTKNAERIMVYDTVYLVKKVYKKYDGRTFIAKIEKI